MGFWKRHMPRGMFRRSACDWHYDPFDEDTIERYVETQGLRPADVEPLSLDFYLGYPEWFRRRKGIEILDARVRGLDHVDEGPARFRATLEDGRTLSATNVALAVGFAHFTNVPETYSSLFPSGRVAHS